jgi:hypothetical protein
MNNYCIKRLSIDGICDGIISSSAFAFSPTFSDAAFAFSNEDRCYSVEKWSHSGMFYL